MTGSAPDEQSRRAAAEQLGVRPDATPAEVRAAFLRQLPGEDFVPAAWLVRSARAMGLAGVRGHRQPPGSSEASREEEESLRAEVEDFACRFWEIPLAERKAAFHGLADRVGPFLTLRLRLRFLQNGLKVQGPELPEGTDPLVAELARVVCGLYLLRPVDRARAWQAKRREMLSSIPDWRGAAQALRGRHRDLAALDPEVVEEVASWRPAVNPPSPPPKKAAVEKVPWSLVGGFLALLVVIAGGLMQSLPYASRTNSNSYPNDAPPSFPLDPPEQDDRAPQPDFWKDDPGGPKGQSTPWMGSGEATRRLLGLPPATAGRGPRPPVSGTPSGKSP